MTKRAFIYCRVSTEEQATDKHHSLEVQEQRARDLVKDRGWVVSCVEKDSASGKDTNRPGFQHLMDSIKDGKIDVLVVYRLDRLSRNVRDIYDCLEAFRKNDVDFVSLNEGFDTSTPMDRAFFGIGAVFSQLTRETIADNVKDALLLRAKKGNAQPGRYISYGYDYTPENGHVINMDEAAVVRRIFSTYGDQKLSLGQIAMVLNNDGVATKTGSQWSTSMVSSVLKNVMYIGRVKFNDQVFDGLHPCIVSNDAFEKAQQRLLENAVIAPRTRTSTSLLSGLVRCGECKQLLSPKKNGKDGRRVTYRCKGNQRTDAKRCLGVSKAAGILEPLVLSRVRSLVGSDEIQKMVAGEIQRLMAEHVDQTYERSTLLLEIQQLDDSFRRWADRLDRGLIDEAQFEVRNRDILERRRVVERHLATMRDSKGQLERQAVKVQDVLNVAKDFDSLWNAGTLEERKALLADLVERLEVTRQAVTLKLRFLPEETIAFPNNRQNTILGARTST